MTETSCGQDRIAKIIQHMEPSPASRFMLKFLQHCQKELGAERFNATIADVAEEMCHPFLSPTEHYDENCSFLKDIGVLLAACRFSFTASADDLNELLFGQLPPRESAPDVKPNSSDPWPHLPHKKLSPRASED